MVRCHFHADLEDHTELSEKRTIFQIRDRGSTFSVGRQCLVIDTQTHAKSYFFLEEPRHILDIIEIHVYIECEQKLKLINENNKITIF